MGLNYTDLQEEVLFIIPLLLALPLSRGSEGRELFCVPWNLWSERTKSEVWRGRKLMVLLEQNSQFRRFMNNHEGS